MALLEPREELAIKEYLDALASGESGEHFERCAVDECPMRVNEGERHCSMHTRQARMGLL